MLAQVFFIDPQHVGRCGDVALHVVVKLKPVHVAQVARFAHAQDDGL